MPRGDFRLRYYSILVLWMIACQPSEHPPEQSEISQAPGLVEMEVEQVSADLMLDLHASSQVLDKEKYFGQFFDQRVSFHIDESPSQFLGGEEVNRMIVTSIDQAVARIKYELSNDISKDLIQAHGSFTFKALHPETLHMAKKDGILVENTINPKLKKYQLKWKLEDRTIVYRHLEDSLRHSFVCYEELPLYEEYFASAARGRDL